MNEIENKLTSHGFTLDQTKVMIKEVEEIIARKIFAYYLNKLNPEQKAQIENLSEKTLLEYLDSNKSNLPILTKDEITNISLKTWEDYFNTLKVN